MLHTYVHVLSVNQFSIVYYLYVRKELLKLINTRNGHHNIVEIHIYTIHEITSCSRYTVHILFDQKNGKSNIGGDGHTEQINYRY